MPLTSCNSTRFTFREKYAARLSWQPCRHCWLKPTCVFYLPFKLELEWRSFSSLVHDQFFKIIIKLSNMLFYKCWQNTSRTLRRSENIGSSFHDFRDKFTRYFTYSVVRYYIFMIVLPSWPKRDIKTIHCKGSLITENNGFWKQLFEKLKNWKRFQAKECFLARYYQGKKGKKYSREDMSFGIFDSCSANACRNQLSIFYIPFETKFRRTHHFHALF